MSLMEHAERELKAIGMLDSGDKYNELMSQNILEVIQVFSKQGHSGGSAAWFLNIFKKLADYEPLTPLTGEDDEWIDRSSFGNGAPYWQNIRCSRVFKQADGTCYDSEGKVFIDSSGHGYTNIDSHVTITFPYMPKTERINVP